MSLLIYISLIKNIVEPYFTCIHSICISSIVNYLFKFYPFFIKFLFYSFSVLSFLLETRSLELSRAGETDSHLGKDGEYSLLFWRISLSFFLNLFQQ